MTFPEEDHASSLGMNHGSSRPKDNQLRTCGNTNKNVDLLFSNDFWKTTKGLPKQEECSSCSFGDVDSHCPSKSCPDNSICNSSLPPQNNSASSNHVIDHDDGELQEGGSRAPAMNDINNFMLTHQIPESKYMENNFQRVLSWNNADPLHESWNCFNWNQEIENSGLLDSVNQKEERKRVLIIPEEDEEEIPFSKMNSSMKSNHRDHELKTNIVNNASHVDRLSKTESQMSSSMDTSISSWYNQSRSQSSLASQAAPQTSLGLSSASVDNIAEVPPTSHVEYSGNFNPYLPVHAERMLMNLGFDGSNNILPERFQKDWYKKMAKAQLESQRMMQCSQSVGPTTYPDNSIEKQTYVPSLVRSTSVTSYQYPEGQFPHEMSSLANKPEQISTGPCDTASRTKRCQFAKSRRSSLPIMLGTLNEEDENVSRNTIIDQFSRAIFAGKKISTTSESKPLGRFNQENQCNIEPNVKLSGRDNSDLGPIDRKPASVIASECFPSKDSLEVADIFHKSHPLEPAMVSILLEDLDGNMREGTCSDAITVHIDASNEHLNIPLSRSPLLSASPIPPSPVTVIEVNLDNQHDSIELDEILAACLDHCSEKESPETETMKTELTTVDTVNNKDDILCEISISLTGPKDELSSEVKCHFDRQCVSVQADDGQLSPVVGFSTDCHLHTWLQECVGDDYFSVCDQNVQCSQESNLSQNWSTTSVSVIDEGCQTGCETCSDKGTQTSVEYASCCIQAGVEGIEVEDNCPNQVGKYLNPDCNEKNASVDENSLDGESVQLFEEAANSLPDRNCTAADDWVVQTQIDYDSSLQAELQSYSNETQTDCGSINPKDVLASDESVSVENEALNMDLELPKFNDDGSPMTKLDMFATTFLDDAEKYCATLKSKSDEFVFEVVKRKDDSLSFPMLNDSWVTQSSDIHSPASDVGIHGDDVDASYDKLFNSSCIQGTVDAERTSVEDSIESVENVSSFSPSKMSIDTSRHIDTGFEPQERPAVSNMNRDSTVSFRKTFFDRGDVQRQTSWEFFSTSVISDNPDHDEGNNTRVFGAHRHPDSSFPLWYTSTFPSNESMMEDTRHLIGDFSPQMMMEKVAFKQYNYDPMTGDEMENGTFATKSGRVGSQRTEQDMANKRNDKTIDFLMEDHSSVYLEDNIVKKNSDSFSEQELNFEVEDAIRSSECFMKRPSARHRTLGFQTQPSISGSSSFIKHASYMCARDNPELEGNSCTVLEAQSPQSRISNLVNEASCLSYVNKEMEPLASHQTERVACSHVEIGEKHIHNFINSDDQIFSAVNVLVSNVNVCSTITNNGSVEDSGEGLEWNARINKILSPVSKYQHSMDKEDRAQMAQVNVQCSTDSKACRNSIMHVLKKRVVFSSPVLQKYPMPVLDASPTGTIVKDEISLRLTENNSFKPIHIQEQNSPDNMLSDSDGNDDTLFTSTCDDDDDDDHFVGQYKPLYHGNNAYLQHVSQKNRSVVTETYIKTHKHPLVF